MPRRGLTVVAMTTMPEALTPSPDHDDLVLQRAMAAYLGRYTVSQVHTESDLRLFSLGTGAAAVPAAPSPPASATVRSPTPSSYARPGQRHWTAVRTKIASARLVIGAMSLALPPSQHSGLPDREPEE